MAFSESYHIHKPLETAISQVVIPVSQVAVTHSRDAGSSLQFPGQKAEFFLEGYRKMLMIFVTDQV